MKDSIYLNISVVTRMAHTVVKLGLKEKDAVVEGLATRWQKGRWLCSLQTISLPVLVAVATAAAVSKSVQIRHRTSDLTTFNILFKNKDDQFRTGA